MARNRAKTEANLKQAAIDVKFEFKMFRQGLGRLDLSSPSPGNNNWAEVVSLTPTAGATAGNSTSSPSTTGFRDIEGVLIHFRNLIEFFFTESQDKDDLVLAHHFTGDQPQKSPAWAKEYQRRCSELLAHLTYGRTRYRQNDEHHWPDIVEKCRLMNDEINAFLNRLSPERRAWFRWVPPGRLK